MSESAFHRPGQGSSLARYWQLNPEVDFLNHGSFGACPTQVLSGQGDIRTRMEKDLVRFFVHDLEGLLDQARQTVATLVRVSAADLVFVPNATYAVNSVLRGLSFSSEDELLTTDQEYNACRNVLDYVARRAGARLVCAPVPFPLQSADVIVESIMSRVTARTRLVLLDHVASQTGLIFPIERIVPRLAERGIDVLIDGAHGVGQLDLDLSATGAAWYTSNCHKWLCAPKGAAFLWTRPDKQVQTRPACISHGANSKRSGRSRYLQEFDWTGTDDPSAYLSVPAALDFLNGILPGGLAAVRQHNRQLALYGRERLCAAMGIDPPAPDELVGSMAAIPLPDGQDVPQDTALYADPLQAELFARQVEVPVVPWPGPPRRLLRISAQLYNCESQYDRLAGLLPDLCQTD